MLLFVGGVMNLFWVALLTVIISIEKLAPASIRVEKWLAGLMVAAAITVLLL